MTYDGQKLFSADQFVKLVHSDKPGHEAVLGIVRNGKLQNVKATLGQHEMAEQPAARPQLRLAERSMEHPQTTPSENPWESFDSMTLHKLGDNRFQIEIQYLNDQGKMEHHAFQGSVREIRRAIRAEKDLPATERQHLLSSLSVGPMDWAAPIFSDFPDLDNFWSSLEF